MVSSHQIAWMQSQHDNGEPPPTFAEALARFDEWLNDTMISSLSTEEAEYRTALGLSLHG